MSANDLFSQEDFSDEEPDVFVDDVFDDVSVVDIGYRIRDLRVKKGEADGSKLMFIRATVRIGTMQFLPHWEQYIPITIVLCAWTKT